MKWQSQLTQLILDYYREDSLPLQELSPLKDCQLSRWWRTFRIDCPCNDVARSLVEHGDLLREPIAQLRLARQVKIFVRGSLRATMSVAKPQSTFQFNPATQDNDADLRL
jgi:hypothetical protein